MCFWQNACVMRLLKTKANVIHKLCAMTPVLQRCSFWKTAGPKATKQLKHNTFKANLGLAFYLGFLGPLGPDGKLSFHCSQPFLNLFSNFPALNHKCIIPLNTQEFPIWKLFPVPHMAQFAFVVPGHIQQVTPQLKKLCSKMIIV